MTSTRTTPRSEIDLTTRPDRPAGMSWRGLLTVAVVTNVVLQAAVMLLAGVVIPPALVLSAVQLLGLALVLRFRRTGAAFVLVGGLGQIAGYLSFAVPNLAMPQSPFDFLDAVSGFLTAALMVVAGVALLRRRTGSPRRLALTGAGTLLAAVVIAAVGAATVTSEPLEDGDVPLVAESYAWSTPQLTATVGDTLHLDNRDPFHHVFVIDGLGIEVGLPGNVAQEVSLDGVAPGVYDFVCPLLGHEAMVGTIEVLAS